MQQRGVVDHLTDSVSLLLPSFQRRQSQPSAIMSRLSHKVQVDVAKCDACHTEWRSMLPNATPATQTAAASTAPNRNQARHQSQPRAISATAGHTKWRSMSPSAMPATQTATASTATNGSQARHQSQPSARSAMPATQSEGRCRQEPCLPHKQPQRARRQTGTKRAARASPAPQVPGLPHKVKVGVAKCHTCHTELRPMFPHATPATQTAAASTATNGDRACHQSQPRARSARQVPCLPHRIVYGGVAKRCACHANSRCVQGDKQEPSAKAQVDAAKRQGGERIECVTELCVSKLCVRELCVRELCVCVSKLCVRELCLSKLCVRELCVCVSKLCVRELCVCVSKLCVRELCASKLCERVVYERVVCVCE